MAGTDDQLVKELIQAFPADFVCLVFPEVATQIDLAAVDFRQEEYFTDSPRGGRPRRPDLMARVPVLAGGEAILHGEIEARYRAARVPGIVDYNRLLGLRHGLAVHTVVVYCRGGPPGLQRRKFRLVSLGQTVAVFHYVSLGLSGMPAAGLLARREPLAWAFAALARPGELGSRAELRIACLRQIVAARHLAEDQRFRLFNFVASYIETGRGVSGEYDELFRHEDNREVQKKMITWAEKMEARGYEKAQRELTTWAERRREEGRRVGFQEGRQEGRQEGEAAFLSRMVTRKFGPLSQGVQRAIESADAKQLLEWGDRFVTARSVEEIFDGKG
jgi:hypothetical protein